MRALKIIGIVVGFAIVLLCSGVLYIGAVSPEKRVVSGAQLPTRFVDTIRQLELIDDDERIRLFYSDGLIGIKEGMYFVTDRQLVIYSESYEQPAIRIAFDQIKAIDAAYSDSWLSDSSVWVTLKDGAAYVFPLGMEAGGDRRFVETLRESAGEDVTYTESEAG